MRSDANSEPKRTADDGAARRVFELYPYGIILLDAEKRVLEANYACRQVLGPGIADARSKLTCCDVFGCRTPDGPLERTCLAEFAAEGSGPQTELRVDLPAGSPVSAAWITAAPFDAGSARTLLEVRPGDRRDRRQRRVPRLAPPERLEIFTLGHTLVRSPVGSLGGSWLSHRAGELFKFLICQRSREVQADEIAATLWPGGDQRLAGNVRHFVHSLRGHLEPGREKRAPSRFILSGPGGYRLNTEAVTIDVDQFEAGVHAGLRSLAQGDTAAAAAALGGAMRLYGGDFLAEERYAIWAFAERDRLRDLASDALAALGDIRLKEGDLRGASVHLDRLADMHPFDSDMQRNAIEVALRMGRHTVARRRYNALRRQLLSEFGSEPSFSLQDLSARLAGGGGAVPSRPAA